MQTSWKNSLKQQRSSYLNESYIIFIHLALIKNLCLINRRRILKKSFKLLIKEMDKEVPFEEIIESKEIKSSKRKRIYYRFSRV